MTYKHSFYYLKHSYVYRILTNTKLILNKFDCYKIQVPSYNNYQCFNKFNKPLLLPKMKQQCISS